MKKLFCILFLTAGLTVQAQNHGIKKTSEWDVLDKTFISLIETLIKGNREGFKAIALPRIYCEECADVDDFSTERTSVPVDIFYLNIVKDFNKSPIYKALAKRGYGFSSVILKNFKPSYLPANYPKDLKIYDVWVDTYPPNEVSKGHKGTRHAFRFIKVNGKFRLYGLTSN